MQIINQKKIIPEWVTTLKSEGKSIGLVPTMGALHEGHLSLVEEACAQCDVVTVSIFVNPTQFDNPADLEKYPRSLETDVALLQKAFPQCVVFAPSAMEMYEGNISTRHFDFGPLENVMEGKYRKGHFDGVGTILQLLFDIVRPEKAFFGEKDFQQLQIVRKLVEITAQPVEIIGCPIEREPNGLARSSRNERLTDFQREEAAFIYQTLQKTKEDFGTKSATFIGNWVHEQFDKNPALTLEYFEIVETDTLKSIEQKKENTSYRAFIAAYLGEVRLIDNIALN